MSLSSADKEMECTIHWFKMWNQQQRANFLNDLVSKAVPDKLCSLLASLETMSVRAETPDIYHLQLRLFTKWFETWTDMERNTFLVHLEVVDPGFIQRFTHVISETAGEM